MSSATETPEQQNHVTNIPNEVLLQVKTLQDLKKSLRQKTFKMKTPPISLEGSIKVDDNNFKKDCQKEAKDKKLVKKGSDNTDTFKSVLKKLTWGEIVKMGYGRGDSKRQYFTNFMAEVIGTALLMFLGCMGCAPQADNPPAVHHMSSLSFGLVVLLIIQIFGHISGAHLNPAVTISTVIFKMLSPAMGAVYIIGQFMGATLGFALLKIVLPPTWVVPGFCMTKPHAEATPIQGFAIEVVITATLILVCCGVWDRRNAEKQDSTPARFGFIVAAISMVAGPLTGASMNTARSFAPAFLEGDFSYQWIYWIGPNVGAVIACGLYLYLFSHLEEAEDEGTELEEVNQMITQKS